jgi:hypothetical protein
LGAGLRIRKEVMVEPESRASSCESLCIGYDSGDAVSDGHKSPGRFAGGTIKSVGVTIEQSQYLDLEEVAAAALAADYCSIFGLAAQRIGLPFSASLERHQHRPLLDPLSRAHQHSDDARRDSDPRLVRLTT